MNRRRCWILFAVSVLLTGSVLSAHAQYPYLKIDGIPGEDTYDGEEGWIEIWYRQIPHPLFSHVMHRDSEGNKIAAFVVVKEIDETSIPICLAMLKGGVIEELTCVIDYWQGFMKWTFQEVTIASVRQFTTEEPQSVVAGYRGSSSIEEIKFTFKRIEWEYTDGDKKVVGGWNVESDTEIPPPTAVNGFTAHQ